MNCRQPKGMCSCVVKPLTRCEQLQLEFAVRVCEAFAKTPMGQKFITGFQSMVVAVTIMGQGINESFEREQRRTQHKARIRHMEYRR